MYISYPATCRKGERGRFDRTIRAMQSIKNQHFGKRNNTKICVWTISSSQQIKHDTKSLTRQTAIPASCSNPVLNVEVLDSSSMRETRDKTQEKKSSVDHQLSKTGLIPSGRYELRRLRRPQCLGAQTLGSSNR